MPVEIKDLDELLPPDITFKYAGKEYAIPGDLSVERTLRLLQTWTEILKLSEQAPVPPKESGVARERRLRKEQREAEEMLKKTKALILDALQERQPELTECPFGFGALNQVLPHVLRSLGVIIPVPASAAAAAGDGGGIPPTSPAANGSRRSRRGSSTRSRSS